MDSLVIVGDKFKTFSENNGVITYSEALFLLNKKIINEQHTSLKLGQGLSEWQVEQLVQTAKASGLLGILSFSGLSKSGKDYVHKHQHRNSMLGLPRKINEQLFDIEVLLDDDCDEMADHITGHHVQGMVVTESARQAFLAVTEAYFLKENDFSSYFVINSLSTKYLNFVFPLPLRIQYEIKQHSAKKHGAHYFLVQMQVFQGDLNCATVDVEFSTYNGAFLEEKEQLLAQEAIQALVSVEASENVAA